MARPFGSPSGHIGIIIYTANLSLALILLAILSAISTGIKLFAPAQDKENNMFIQGHASNQSELGNYYGV